MTGSLTPGGAYFVQNTCYSLPGARQLFNAVSQVAKYTITLTVNSVVLSRTAGMDAHSQQTTSKYCYKQT
jgi:hypothetical protein